MNFICSLIDAISLSPTVILSQIARMLISCLEHEPRTKVHIADIDGTTGNQADFFRFDPVGLSKPILDGPGDLFVWAS